MKIRLSFMVLVLFLCYRSIGQNAEGTVYLKNGSIIKGEIIENNTQETKVAIFGGSVLAFPANEVEITEMGTSRLNLQKNKIRYAFTLSGGSLIGSSKNDERTPLSLLMEHQMRYNQVSFGGLLGVEFLNEAVMPLGLTLKWIYPVANRTELFLGCSGGILHSLEAPTDPYNQIKEHNGGTFVNPELGIIFTSVSRTRLFVAAGYRYAELHYVYNNWWYTEVQQDMYFNRFSIRFGLWFE